MRQTVSDAQGMFELEVFAAGTYELSVNAANYQHLEKSVVVAAGGTELEIELTPVVTQTVTVSAADLREMM